MATKSDDEDELLGTLDETEPGEYQMTDLRFSCILAKESKAPEGFYLDGASIMSV